MASAMVAIGFLCASTAEAAFIIYTDRASWELALQSLTTEDFEAVPVGAFSPGTTMVGTVEFFYDVEDPGAAPGVYDGGSVNGSRELVGTVWRPPGGGGIRPGINTFTLPAMIDAWGADFEWHSTGIRLVADVGSASFRLEDYATPSDTFLGVISD